MDIGNLPIFSGSKDKKSTSNSEQAGGNRSRSFDTNNSTKNEEKSAWEQIGDYDQPAAAAANNHVGEDEDDEDHEQVQIPRKHTQAKEDSKKESDDAASIASEAAVKATQQHGK
ncbi:hypothetical protein MUCCIDRAFT_114115 [Mucor lusitanicus CBS 277.49]|uniref:Uncharacterized protein n=1 Tax=Mucor lusitanicus CBS 277.49 TaxID=747725 RepID=A0A168J1D2_MUCCL|nr:hypothetical protein MUCCIDRAFT_114115 [Mucor lusitanicus CBS 277.49]